MGGQGRVKGGQGLVRGRYVGGFKSIPHESIINEKWPDPHDNHYLEWSNADIFYDSTLKDEFVHFSVNTISVNTTTLSVVTQTYHNILPSPAFC